MNNDRLLWLSIAVSVAMALFSLINMMIESDHDLQTQAPLLQLSEAEANRIEELAW